MTVGIDDQGASLARQDLTTDEIGRIAVALHDPLTEVALVAHVVPIYRRITKQDADALRRRDRAVHFADRAKERRGVGIVERRAGLHGVLPDLANAASGTSSPRT